MNYRRTSLLALALLAAFIATCTFPFWRSYPIGFCKGESAYQGRYTNYWKEDLQQWKVVAAMSDGGSTWRWRAKRPPPWDGWLNRSNRWLTCGNFHEHPLMRGDPDAVPVLLELLREPEKDIRLIAIEALAMIGPEAKSAVPALFEAMEGDDDEVSMEAEDAMFTIDYEKARGANLRWGKERWHHPPREKSRR